MDFTREWLEADGLGGFASGTASTVRTRRYHGWLLSARTPPTGREMLVAGLEAWVEGSFGRIDLIANRYAPGVLNPALPDARFERNPWPTWTAPLPNGNRVTMEVFVVPGAARTWLRWSAAEMSEAMTLHVRPLLASRDYHSLQHENGAADLAARVAGGRVAFRLCPDAPEIACLSNGTWRDDPLWFRQFEYREELERGLDATEDLAAPGVLSFSLQGSAAVAVFGAGAALDDLDVGAPVQSLAASHGEAERRRRQGFGDQLALAADSYFVSRGSGRTLIAGYPWFTDWGRDTFIAMRGLCLATGRYEDARDILLAWARRLDRGMLPNRFPDRGEAPEYNSVDAALWFVIVCYELLEHTGARHALSAPDRRQLQDAVISVLQWYADGTRFGIRMDGDGLLRAGEAGVQLTWMDARVDGREITPRIGKPVEIQALWVNALAAGATISGRWTHWLGRARASFERRFAASGAAWLPDVVDVDHVPGTSDLTLRPNQVLALGGLPLPLLTGEPARAIVDIVEAQLWTPLGLRSLGPNERGYAARYEGGPSARDAVYHQGTVWPWLLGAFVDAWIRTRGGGEGVVEEARARFIAPMIAHLDEAGLGHVSEIADATAPYRPRGCPFQAWSLGELIRLDRQIAPAVPRTGGARSPAVRSLA